MSKLVDSEDRARRCNLLFFGLKDADPETWAESEHFIFELCKDKFDVSINPMDIERAHRIGRFDANKNRPIIVNFAYFKTKEKILSFAYKLKNTGYSISEDFSKPTLLARKQLLAFAKVQKQKYKLRHNKLGKTTYTYDQTSKQVFLRTP